MLKIIIKVLIIGAVATGLALAVNGKFIRQSLSGELIVTTNTEELKKRVPSLKTISLAEAKERHDSKSATFVDARLQPLYEDGHIAGAISFPVKDYEKTQNLDKIAQLKDSKVVIYCSGKDCPDSGTLAAYLSKQGFMDLEVFEGGWPEWSGAGYPTEKNP